MSDEPTIARKITLIETCDLVPINGPAGGAAEQRFGLLIFCDAEVQFWPLEDSSAVVVGREPPAEIVVDDASVSRQHARFVREGNEIWLEDLESRNGTRVRGNKITRARLVPADEATIGRVRVVLAATLPLAGASNGSADSDEIVIQSPEMQRIYRDAARAARGKLPVLVLGETGTGKELVARAIHRESDRRSKPFVAVNCAAIAPSLIESTLFGHERGAFTGAINRNVGVFERADGGVLFLDEVGDLPPGVQVALLRALETGRISRVGSPSEIQVDVRIVAATHCDLQTMVDDRSFRSDLFFRLNGIALDLPPLRERTDEIEPLVNLFMARARREWGTQAQQIAPEAMALLLRYSWPGNIRQLQHAIERAALIGADETISKADLPRQILSDVQRMRTREHSPDSTIELALRQQLQRYERALIEEALRRASGNRQAAAKLLRIPLRTLFRKLRAGNSLEAPESQVT